MKSSKLLRWWLLPLAFLVGCGSGGGNSAQSAQFLYVPYYCSTSADSSVQIFAGNSTAGSQPLGALQGDATGIVAPTAVALDALGDLYVANASSTVSSIEVFGPNASGDVAPIQLIEGSNTGLNQPFGVAVDASNDIWVANEGAGNVLEFKAGSTGNVAPIATIAGSNTGLGTPPLGPLEISLDQSGNIYVTSVASNSVMIFAPGSNGNVAPTTTIAGSTTGLDGPVQAVVGPNGEIYVSNNTQCYPDCTGTEPFSITVYPANSNGDVSPVNVIGGSNTTLYLPAGIALDALGNLYVVNEGNNDIQIFAAGAAGNATPTLIPGANSPECVARDIALF